MIKRIIFDIDNTLFDTKKDCLDSYKIFFQRKQLPDYSEFLYQLLQEYDDCDNYAPRDLTSYIGKNVPFKYTMKDFKEMYQIYEEHATVLEKDIEKTLNKLSQKYELVILTSWYLKDQEARLNKANILKYFRKIYAYDNAGLKPSEKAFKIACGDFKPTECLMVGDSIKNDIIVPLSLGIKTFLYNPKSNKTKYKSIKKISDLLKEEF